MQDDEREALRAVAEAFQNAADHSADFAKVQRKTKDSFANMDMSLERLARFRDLLIRLDAAYMSVARISAATAAAVQEYADEGHEPDDHAFR